jgi:APA family basic amino acid/polyamine antiporter
MFSPQQNAEEKLERKLGMFDSTMIVMGIVIGGGIFYTTGIMAQNLPSAPLILLAWTVGGLLSLCGALIYAELGAAMPEAGGQFVYLSRAYGPLLGFLFGWTYCFVSLSGVIAVLAVALSDYLSYFFPFLSPESFIFSSSGAVFGMNFQYSLSTGHIFAIIVIIGISIMNFLGLGLGKFIQNMFTVIKIGTIIAFCVAGIVVGKKIPLDLSFNPSSLSFSHLVGGLTIALVTASLAYAGWENLNFIGGEIKNPGRNLPVALILGTVGVTFLYIVMNYVYVRALPIEEMSGVIRVAEKSTSALFSGPASGLISAAVAFSVIGALNGVILSTPRVYYAMAKDKLFFDKVARLHPRYHTPGFAMLIQAIWASVLVLSGTFEQLITFVMFAIIVFWMITAASVFVFRKKYPDMPRPYKTWGYPVIPIVFILATLGIIINTIAEQPQESLTGLGIILIGIPVYFFWHRKRKELEPGNSHEYRMKGNGYDDEHGSCPLS